MPAAEAQEVMGFLYGQAASVSNSRELIDELDRFLQLEDVNNIQSVEKSNNATYQLMVFVEAECTRHEIIVQRIGCGLEKCALKVNSNRKWGYP